MSLTPCLEAAVPRGRTWTGSEPPAPPCRPRRPRSPRLPAALCASAAPSGKEREGSSCRDLAAWPPRPPTACSPGQDVRRSRSSFCAARGLASLSSGAHAGSGVQGRAVSRGRPYAWPAPHHPATSGSMPCSSSNLLLNSSPRRLDSKKWEYQVTTSGVLEAGKIIIPVTRDLSSWLVCQSLVGFIVVSFLLRPESPGGLIKPAPPGAGPRALRRCQPVPALSCLSWCLPRRIYCYINQLLEWMSGITVDRFQLSPWNWGMKHHDTIKENKLHENHVKFGPDSSISEPKAPVAILPRPSLPLPPLPQATWPLDLGEGRSPRARLVLSPLPPAVLLFDVAGSHTGIRHVHMEKVLSS